MLKKGRFLVLFVRTALELTHQVPIVPEMANLLNNSSNNNKLADF